MSLHLEPLRTFARLRSQSVTYLSPILIQDSAISPTWDVASPTLLLETTYGLLITIHPRDTCGDLSLKLSTNDSSPSPTSPSGPFAEPSQPFSDPFQSAHRPLSPASTSSSLSAASSQPTDLSWSSEDGPDIWPDRLLIMPTFDNYNLWWLTATNYGVDNDLSQERIVKWYGQDFFDSLRAWGACWDRALENSSLGRRGVIFPDLEERVAWQPEGMLLALFLILPGGGGATKVEYRHFGEPMEEKDMIGDSIIWLGCEEEELDEFLHIRTKVSNMLKRKASKQSDAK